MNHSKTTRWLAGICLSSVMTSLPGYAAAMLVYDHFNWVENIKILTTQLDQYKQQLRQYDNLLQNTKSLNNFQWDDANHTINNLVRTTDTLGEYKKQAGSLENYLNRYQTSDYYSRNSCMNGGCTREQRAQLEQNKIDAANAQKKSRDAMMRGLDEQQQTLTRDAANLERLQKQAKDADGQKQAIQAASQLASSEANQLLQIRSLLVSQHTAEVTREAEKANREAMEEAADARFRAGTFKKSSGKTW